MSRIEVPAEAYVAAKNGEISQEELAELEKFASVMNKEAVSPGQLAGIALAAPALAYVGAQVPAAIEGSLSSFSFNSDLKRVLEVNPRLRETANDKEIRMAFKTIRTLNPTYSKDPLIAGTLLENVLSNRSDPNDPSSTPRVDPATLSSIVGDASKLPSAQTQKGVMSGIPGALASTFK